MNITKTTDTTKFGIMITMTEEVCLLVFSEAHTLVKEAVETFSYVSTAILKKKIALLL